MDGSAKGLAEPPVGGTLAEPIKHQTVILTV